MTKALPSTYVDKPCHHEYEFVTSDYDQIATTNGLKDGYIEFFECIHCGQKMRALYTFLLEEEY